MKTPEHFTLTLTLPRNFTFTAAQWARLGHTLSAACVTSPITYFVSQADQSVLVQEVNPDPALSDAVQGGLLVTRTLMGYDLTSHAAHGERSADHMMFGLLIHAASEGKVKLRANVHAPERWAEAASALNNRVPGLTLSAPKVGRI